VIFTHKQAEKSTETAAFLQDARRFILHWRSTIDATPLQLYSSAIVFSPEQSIIRRTFEKDISKWILSLSEVDDDWSACLQTFEGHTGAVRSVAFSADGSRLVSASEDCTIKIWDTYNDKCILTLEGHIYHVTSAILTNNDKHVVSSSIDRTIRIWNAITGKCLHIIDNGGSGVSSIACSSDGGLLASASFDKLVKIWNLAASELHSSRASMTTRTWGLLSFGRELCPMAAG
jgi:WD40 repeat protein